ncbi:MAG: hypothetical protein LBS29_04765 [Endomicrobium sp.]|jgi:hypothetical protein|nr:hypothetical protein [Endomicrobium sp.]
MNVKDLIELRQKEFIEKRLLISQWIDTLIKNSREIDPELFIKYNIEPLKGDNVKSLLPSLFIKPFNKEQYLMEKEVIDIYQKKLDLLADKLNEEALQLLRGVQ